MRVMFRILSGMRGSVKSALVREIAANLNAALFTTVVSLSEKETLQFRFLP